MSLAASDGAAWHPRRRSFLLGGGALFGSTLLGGLTACGGGDDGGDPIWGESGAATKIIDALKSVSQSSFPADAVRTVKAKVKLNNKG